MAAMTAAERGFLEAIERDPEDHAARVVYADWLEEVGDGERAEYIRLEAELHRIGPRLKQLHARLDPPWLEAVSRKRRLVLVSVTPNIIECIKLIREISGRGLKEAKDIVEAVRERGAPMLITSELGPGAADAAAQRFEGLATVRVETMSGVPLPSR